jgi:Tol biopolymer transport system component
VLAAVLASMALAAAPAVPRRGVVAADAHGRLLVLDARGRKLRSVPGRIGSAQGVAVAPDRRHAYVSVYRADAAARLYRVDLASGRRTLVAHGLSPSLSPDGTRLAYLESEYRGDIKYVTALVVLDLRGGPTRRLPLGNGIPQGTPPEVILSWAPDSRRIARYDGRAIRIADASRAGPLASQPAIQGPGLAPVFADDRTLVLLANCCIGRQRLVALDLASGARTAFARISSPDETAQRLRDGELLMTTALGELVVVSRGHVRVLAHGITAAAGYSGR